MLRSVSRRERVFLVAGAAVLLAFLAWRTLPRALLDGGLRARRQIPERTAVLEAYLEAVGREGVLAEEAAALEEAILGYRETFLPGGTPALAAASLQTRYKELAEGAGLRIQSEKILAQVARDAYLELPVQVVANGDIRTLRDFIVAVERSPVFVGIRELGLRSVKRRQFVPETRQYVDLSDIQATMTLVGIVPAP